MMNNSEFKSFQMTNEEFQAYKWRKVKRLIPYVIAMFLVSILKEAIVVRIHITFWLLLSYNNDYSNEVRWIEEGSIQKKHLSIFNNEDVYAI